jgi:hypothetical protein
MSDYPRKSPLGLAILVTDERSVLLGFPNSVLTDRLWESGHEFGLYLEEQGIGLGLPVEQRTTPTGFYAVGDLESLHSLLDAIEDHFFTDAE